MDGHLSQQASHAILTDGTVIVIRPLSPADSDRVMALHQTLTEEERYLRFFTVHPADPQKWARSLTELSPDQYAVGAFDSKGLLGVADYVKSTRQQGYAEVAVVVAHGEHFRGVGTAVLLQLGRAAKRNGIDHLVAEVLAENCSMLHVITDAGWPCSRHLEGTVIHIEIDLDRANV